MAKRWLSRNALFTRRESGYARYVVVPECNRVSINVTEKTKKTTNNLKINEEERLILESLKEEALYIDKIIKKTNLPAATVSTNLTIMEMKKQIRDLGANIYTLWR